MHVLATTAIKHYPQKYACINVFQYHYHTVGLYERERERDIERERERYETNGFES